MVSPKFPDIRFIMLVLYETIQDALGINTEHVSTGTSHAVLISLEHLTPDLMISNYLIFKSFMSL